jgi:hypothetical protein
MQLPPRLVLWVPASPPPKAVVSQGIGYPGSEWALGLVDSFPQIVWVKRIGPISAWGHD